MDSGSTSDSAPVPSVATIATCPGIAYCRWYYDLTSLASNSTYYFRLAISDAAGTRRGAIRSFSTTASPIISNLAIGLVTLNDASCTFPTGAVGSKYLVSFAYADADGDVSATGLPITLSWVFQPGNSSGSIPLTVSARTGNGYGGTVTSVFCTRFAVSTSVTNSVVLRDDAGNTSNVLSATTSKPEGANLSGSAREGAMSVSAPPSGN